MEIRNDGFDDKYVHFGIILDEQILNSYVFIQLLVLK